MFYPWKTPTSVKWLAGWLVHSRLLPCSRSPPSLLVMATDHEAAAGSGLYVFWQHFTLQVLNPFVGVHAVPTLFCFTSMPLFPES